MFRRDRYGTRVPNEQEWRVIKFVAQGLKNSEIAEAMGTTRYVIANHIRAIYDKLGSEIELNWLSGMKLASTAKR
jgi:DNA-binding NarL/FixJ family response regulator